MDEKKKKTGLLKPAIRTAGALLLIPALLSLSACVVAYEPAHEVLMADGSVAVTPAPPAPLVETVTVAPFPGMLWVGGYWGWNAGRYVWVSGGWHHPPRSGAVWVGGNWARRPAGGHVWVSGHWR